MVSLPGWFSMEELHTLGQGLITSFSFVLAHGIYKPSRSQY